MIDLFSCQLEKTADLLTKRMYTHKVLRQLQIMISQTELSLDLWLILLQVFLAIGDTVLSPPYRSMTLQQCHISRNLKMQCLLGEIWMGMRRMHISKFPDV